MTKAAVEHRDEIWKPIPGYTDYEVSSLGRVKSLKRLPIKILSGCVQRGYRCIHLSNGEVVKRWFVHQLVMLAFKGPKPQGMHCAHLNGVRDDNRPENLIYCTPKENNAHKKLHGTHMIGEQTNSNKLTEAEAKAIYDSRFEYTRKQLAEKYKVDRETIRRILTGKHWTHVTSAELKGKRKTMIRTTTGKLAYSKRSDE